MKVDMRNTNFENIQIQNTSLVGSNFVRCNISGSQFENVNISGMNLNGAILFNCKRRKIKIHGELNQLDGHKDCVNLVCFSPDCTTIASGSGKFYGASNDSSILLWDIKTGQQKSKLDGHQGSVNSVCFSPDGSMLASGSTDKSICLWDVKTRKKIAKLDGHSGYVYSVCFSLDGTTLASGSYNSISLQDVKIGKQKSKFDGHDNWVMSVGFSPDGNTLASGSVDKSIRIWEVKTGKYIQSSDKSYKDILAQFKTPLFQNNPLPESISTNITIVLISQTQIFQAQGALVLLGEFINYQGVDLRSLLKSKGSFILDKQVELQQK